MAFRILPGLIGAFFLLQATGWLVDPDAAAAGLGMPLLDGLARSTQVGDISAFFLAAGGMALFGAVRVRPAWIRPAAVLFASAALMRTLAWAFQGATFATAFIVIEVVTASVLWFCADRLDAPRAAADGHSA